MAVAAVSHASVEKQPYHVRPRVGSGVVRIDPLLFLAGCHKRRLSQALSILSLSLGFF